MERLSVATAVAGSLAVGVDILDALSHMQRPAHRGTLNPLSSSHTSSAAATPPLNGADVVSLAIREIKQYRSSIQVLEKTLSLAEAAQLPFPDRASWVPVDYLIAILTDTVLAFSDLQAALDAEPVSPGVVGQQGARVKSLCSRIRWLNISLTLILTILKCPADPEAQTCRKALDQRMTRLLASNTDLSSRMRQLGDVFNAKAMAPHSRQQYLNHQYSLHQHSHDPRTPRQSTPSPRASAGALTISPAPPTTTTMNMTLEGRDWSTFSRFTLADLCIPSTIAVPLTTYELYDSRPYYVMDDYDDETDQYPPPPHSQPQQLRPATAPPAPVKSQVTATTTYRSGFAGRVKRLSPRRRKKKDGVEHQISEQAVTG